MPGYVDGFVMPMPRANLDRYREIAGEAGELWIEHGALEYKECIAEDVQMGEVTSFPRSVKQEEGETVVFAWITYESRAHRDEVNAKVMEDERMKALMDPASDVADHQRMIYGGFDILVDL
jgi:uncharacterized protein YbaA (DUF1428 family)